MSYYKILGLGTEPFSTNPDPMFFYESRGHKQALTNLIIEMRLRRGLSIILGDIGTGKTTLSRKLIQALSSREGFVFQIILDPTYENEKDFLVSLVRTLGIENILTANTISVSELKETIQNFLFQKGVKENKTMVLIIDEAQKLSEASLEVLRILLNYETNVAKLIQVVLLGQLELHAKIINIPNLIDRISFKYTLNPLDQDEVGEMITYRLVQAGYKLSKNLFTGDAIKEIYRYTHGYPRKVALLCHKALKNIVMNNRMIVDDKIIRHLMDEEAKNGWHLPEKMILAQKSNF
ncbi:MAG: AAA family ATPase [Planctomycetota bacterium]|nr:AAA family ATPase [Planctomycetota bacterium]MDI6787172.1 AAA family ATPase [Planctomycetota bacterium]